MTTLCLIWDFSVIGRCFTLCIIWKKPWVMFQLFYFYNIFIGHFKYFIMKLRFILFTSLWNNLLFFRSMLFNMVTTSYTYLLKLKVKLSTVYRFSVALATYLVFNSCLWSNDCHSDQCRNRIFKPLHEVSLERSALDSVGRWRRLAGQASSNWQLLLFLILYYLQFLKSTTVFIYKFSKISINLALLNLFWSWVKVN